MLAAYVKGLFPRNSGETLVEIDLGSADFIAERAGWLAAVLDANDRPVTGWFPVKVKNLKRSTFVVPLVFSDLQFNRVALHSAEDPNPRHEWPEPYP